MRPPRQRKQVPAVATTPLAVSGLFSSEVTRPSVQTKVASPTVIVNRLMRRARYPRRAERGTAGGTGCSSGSTMNTRPVGAPTSGSAGTSRDGGERPALDQLYLHPETDATSPQPQRQTSRQAARNRNPRTVPPGRYDKSTGGKCRTGQWTVRRRPPAFPPSPSGVPPHPPGQVTCWVDSA
jgi:hypothetical protein